MQEYKVDLNVTGTLYVKDNGDIIIKPDPPIDPPIEPPINPGVEQRISAGADYLGLSIAGQAANNILVVKDAFTTLNGNWEVGEQDSVYAIEQWARDDYLLPWGDPAYFDDAGADHHLFAAVLGRDGNLMRLRDIIYWSDGYEMINDPDYQGYVEEETKMQSGWINIPIFDSSSFSPERNENGPWCWKPSGNNDVICGGGLPNNLHVSTFVVWQEV